ncbi:MULTISPECIES: sensor histidine kinase [Clostridium]|uniref:histidine kinase n=1 Tax=Clostridium acetobutylicum (strain ATCC 824 / DSM 792 / JCM 1419 / IAM 19013 / LMG 5710 / NBRC 13948 / NRRL B-527 / VKM B-1787 / 2291 / W) TaxID=272562 RepID=Q97MF9_CLOAB|nr:MULTISPECIES: sensor histidine kinase [Clostridium]AAK78220.1 Histidine kinase-like ATPase [Clostridium acetobutylicum ATCC 824]ADZ19286.1 Histidine kinase-like ATPase [Clostridium acetobutylicum EA 2018]AEI33832.1 histidine kinase-like ATPase [Clostridium acetobutylicum DSM 1731]AWV82028.1 sensor histidine kinase [Clostridium acetobutylicum]MBC2396074.1 sensor histidine kinase [Clostridium acetobutylicum]
MNNKFLIILKTIFFLYVLIQLCTNGVGGGIIVIIFLTNVILFVLKERFLKLRYGAVVELISVIISGLFNSYFVFLLPGVIFDLVYDEFYLGIALALIGIIYFREYSNLNFSVFCLISGMLAYCLINMRKREELYRKTFDDERRLVYELENAKTRLMNSSLEVAHMAEIKERNRIARDIHDNVGHSIAGTYMQLQVALKLYDKDSEKSKKILKESTERISEALTLIRNTVHNIVPKEKVGIEYIKNIINNFKFCSVDFSYTGSEELVSAINMQIIALNVKEALTNALKYSAATKVIVNIDINDKYIRLYIKDNGVGCSKMKEGLGISGMRERIRSVGGSISTSGENGFLIVCIIPINNGGGKIFEGINS